MVDVLDPHVDRIGRIGLAVYRKNPRVVFAVVESDEGGRLSEFEESSRAGGVFPPGARRTAAPGAAR